MATAARVRGSAGRGDKSERTPRRASAGGFTEAGGPSSTFKAQRRSPAPTVLVESSNAPPELPAGWTMKTFQRANSKKGEKSTDKYFYSPKKKIKFRSLKACREFTEILKELRANNRWKYGLWDPPGGSESAALEVFKARGHRM
ncbi:hypothetical protein ACHAXA_001372 [Cyclostephanos tholiformis]|jgi:hypothetical protein|uniref:MBD domain-containing protein n=1 Tax=Cyclostephanos tholiformis TaxID=382380 RepID=A0ABD3RDR4_9STRA